MSPGYPTPRAMVADNDLALGRIVEAISHSRFWDSTAIFVTEDDSQAGWDHISAIPDDRFCHQPFFPASADRVNQLKSDFPRPNKSSKYWGIPPMKRHGGNGLADVSTVFAGKRDTTTYTVIPKSESR